MAGNNANRKRQSVTKSKTFTSIILVICVCFFLYFYKEKIVGENENVSGDFAVHFIDVGQGDSILIQSPENEFMLIDTGESDQYGKLSGYLEHFDVTEFKYVVFTHPHSDHIGAADKIVKNYDIETLIMSYGVNNTKTFERLITEIENKNMDITIPKPGASYKLGNAEFIVLAPLSEEYSNLNNYSVVIEMKYGSTKFLFTGDMEAESENEVIEYCEKNGFDISADILKVAHHGSSTSSKKSFLELVKPSVAIIMCGDNNSYNHPNLKTVERIESMGTTIYRTDLEGDIVVISDGANFSVKKGREEAVNY